MPESVVPTDPETETISTGNIGLDDILGGGFDADRVYLIEGRPGTGKTTLALQFLLEGVRLGERCLYVTLSESERELRAVVARHGWTLAGIDVFELVPPEASLDPEQELTLFHPAEMELSETTKKILDQVTAINPKRVVFVPRAESHAAAPATAPPSRRSTSPRQTPGADPAGAGWLLAATATDRAPQTPTPPRCYHSDRAVLCGEMASL